MSSSNPAGRIRWLLAALAALGLSLLMIISGASPAGARSGPLRLDSLARVAAADPDRRVSVIVQLEGTARPRPAMTLVRRLGGTTTEPLAVIHGFGAELSARGARRVARAPGIRAVTLNGHVAPQAVKAGDIAAAYPFSVGAPDAWNKELPVTGKGVGVAVIDTGIAGDLPDFRVSAGDQRSRVVASAVVHPGAHTAGDGYGHGTHVAGIIAGNGWNRSSADPLIGRYVGVAPDANLISVKASDEAGNATVLDVIYGLQFVVDHRDEYNIRVVNLSLESTTAQAYRTDPLDAAVEAAWFHGIVVVAAAGNRGASEGAVRYAPGNDPYVISVGGVDDQGTRGNGDDVMATWSSRGTTQDGYAKPELYAPGARIVSTVAPGSLFPNLCPACVVDDKMFRAGGTSMAAPMVSGAVALLLEAHPELSPDQVKGTLARSARLLPGAVPEVAAYGALRSLAYGGPATANEGLAPNELVGAASGDVDYSRSSWSRSSWSTAPAGDLTATWARSSWSCTCSTDGNGSMLPSRSSWSRSSWSTDWSK